MPTRSVNDINNLRDHCAERTATVLTNGMSLFTVAGGPIVIRQLVLYCETANDATASTVQFEAISADGQATTTISGTSTSLASAAPGTMILLQAGTLTSAPAVTTNAGIGGSNNSVVVDVGTINLVVNIGSTTGKWKAMLLYAPVSPHSEVY